MSAINIIGYAIAGWLMLFSVQAAPLNEMQALSVYAVAFGQTHHLHNGNRDVLHNRPPVEPVPQARLCVMEGLLPDCRVLGQYRDGIVYVANSLDFSKIEDISVLLHEYIHHIQYLAHGPVTGCADSMAREAEARKIQARVLDASMKYHAARLVRYDAMQMRCADE